MTRILYQFAERWLWLAWTVVAALVLSGALWLAEGVEQFVLPVVSKFEVLSIKSQPDGSIHVSGLLMKERDCEIVRVWAVGDKNDPVGIYRIPGASIPGSTNLPTGLAGWGPWRIDPSGSRFVTIYSEHTCHPLWTTTTLLASFSVRPRYE